MVTQRRKVTFNTVQAFGVLIVAAIFVVSGEARAGDAESCEKCIAKLGVSGVKRSAAMVACAAKKKCPTGGNSHSEAESGKAVKNDPSRSRGPSKPGAGANGAGSPGGPKAPSGGPLPLGPSDTLARALEVLLSGNVVLFARPEECPRSGQVVDLLAKRGIKFSLVNPHTRSGEAKRLALLDRFALGMTLPIAVVDGSWLLFDGRDGAYPSATVEADLTRILKAQDSAEEAAETLREVLFGKLAFSQP